MQILKQRCIQVQVTWPYKSIAAQVTHTAQARCGKEIFWKIETVGPLLMSCIHVVGDCIGTVISDSVEVVIGADVYAVLWVKRSRAAGTRNSLLQIAARQLSAPVWGPVGAGL